jgi:hypothetical protein
MKNTSPPTQLPPWKCRNRHDAQQLVDWTNARLDERQAPVKMVIQFDEINSPDKSVVAIGSLFTPPPLAYALEFYHDTGDLGLLRQADAKYAEYLSRKQRGRPLKEKHGDKVWEAVRDVFRIRDIWQEHFGKYYRSGKDRIVVTAEQIAKDRNGINRDADQVTFEQRLKKYKKPF